MISIVRKFFSTQFRTVVLWSLVPLCLFMVPFQVQEAQAVTCHCFKERSFKPSQPASADPYILATTRNSLLAAAAGIDKGAVIRLRMKGIDETDLWLSHYLSTRVDKSADHLLDARDKASSWAAALDAVELKTEKLGTTFLEARKKGDAENMARALADPVLATTFEAGEPTLARLHDNGANIAESALSLFLAGKLDRAPEGILEEVKKGEITWGVLLNSLGIKIDTVGDLIAEAVTASID
jgi:hypothetical protein